VPTLKVSTVFISSRIDELAVERRAVFEAINQVGLVPILYEIEPRQDTVTRINTLIDRADFFVGLYSHTIGEKNRDLLEYYPIEYELIRFLAAFDRNVKGQLFRTRRMEDFNRALEDKAYTDKLLPRLRKELMAGEGNLFNLFRQRVCLFEKDADGDWPVSVRLTKFLEGLERIPFKTEQRRLSEGAASLIPEELRLEMFVPPHATLFELVVRELGRRLYVPGNASPSSAIRLKSAAPVGPRVVVDVEGPDTAGRLHAVLDTCFQHWINVSAISIFDHGAQRKGQSSSVMTRVRGVLFSDQPDSNASDDADRSGLQQSIERALPTGHKVDVRMNEFPPTDLSDDWRPVGPRTGSTFLRIDAANVPGLMVQVSALILSYECSISYVDFDLEREHASSGNPRVSNGKAYLGFSSIQSRRTAGELPRHSLEQLIYQLRAVIGVRAVSELAIEQLKREIGPPPSEGGPLRARGSTRSKTGTRRGN
jgi:hypothetical protein